MTYQIFKKNNKWLRSYTELGDGKYDDTMFIELPDCMIKYENRVDLSLDELIELSATNKRGFVGMYGLREHYDLPSTERKTCSTL